MSNISTQDTVSSGLSSNLPAESKEISASLKGSRLYSSYGTGRRKCAVARVWLKQGTGAIIVNRMPINSYFKRLAHTQIALSALVVTNAIQQFDVKCTVKGGGLSGQAGAIQLGISRALNNFNPELRHILKQHKLLTRDSRIVERKKYGRHKARKKTQFSKR
ncbi:ribosomal S9/S16 family protein [Orientia chuto str. Dubai]|uniref:Small ribosomal subunit protein uS9 n=1 Tax=Orientia chuto str. Dubai TaxID=1359168 RepID=A0A0F3MPX6_9RICK|nr:30S ribosomal protein S9 [Candidatus Orientia mediorientalis]KJV56644.1 ribosomal S9/S16 family protein [Orientia chuto str. Dubai]